MARGSVENLAIDGDFMNGILLENRVPSQPAETVALTEP
jgi:hypothetical protein